MAIFETDRQDRIYFYLKLYEDMKNGEKLINTFDIFEMLSKKNQKKVSFTYFEIYKEGIETLFEVLNFLESTYPNWGKRIGKKIYKHFYMECNIKTRQDFIDTFNDDIKIKGVSKKYLNIIREYLEGGENV